MPYYPATVLSTQENLKSPLAPPFGKGSLPASGGAEGGQRGGIFL